MAAAYVECFMSYGGNFLPFLPILLFAVLSGQDEEIAILASFGVSLIVNFLDFYRHRYVHEVVFPNILNVAVSVAYIFMMIYYFGFPDQFELKYASPMIISTLLVTSFFSMVVGYPFTIQFSSKVVSKEQRANKLFVTFNQYLTLYWTLIFAIMTTCIWYSSLLLEPNSWQNVVVGTVIPLCGPIIGLRFTPTMVQYIQVRVLHVAPPSTPVEQAGIVSTQSDPETPLLQQ